MPLSTVTVTGGTFGWITPDNLVPAGQVVFQPVQPLTGGGYILAASSVTAPLVAGNISKVIANTAQLASLQYIVTEQITGVSNPPPYVITPSGASLDLSTAPRGTLGVLTPLYVQTSALGVAGGVATLDGTAKVPTTQLPRIIVRQAYVTTGNVTVPNTASGWQQVVQTGGALFELPIPAVAGDYVEIGVHAMRKVDTATWLDVGVMRGTSVTRYLATGTSAPASEGDPGWYYSTSWATTQSSPRGFTVAAGDIDTGGIVRMALMCRGDGNANGIIYASATWPFYWQAKNYGPVS